VKVLAIDGGGIRGLIPALVLAELERRCDRPAADMFDLIAGTSTGGILACGLTRPRPDGRPRFSAAELADLYDVEGPRVFHRSLLKRILSVEGWIDERYDDGGLMASLERYFGAARLRDALTDVLITAYDIRDRCAFFFRSSRARADPAYDFSLVEAARATSGAPTYFEPVEVTDAAGARTYPLIDGGVFAVNPAMVAYTEVALMGRELDVLVSLGTGSAQHPLAVARVRGWGQLEWARSLIDVVFDGVADTIEFELRTLLGERYVRMQTSLAGASESLDDAGTDNLRALRGLAERLIEERSAELDRLCAALAG
jgi:patatin-like phospholipase/acyl hydrolase